MGKNITTTNSTNEQKLKTQEYINNRRLFIIMSIFILFLYLITITGNLKILTMFASIAIATAWVFQDFLSNLGSTLILKIYPQFERGDVLQLNDIQHHLTMIFNKVGFLRSILINKEGGIVYVPNRKLLNDIISIR